MTEKYKFIILLLAILLTTISLAENNAKLASDSNILKNPSLIKCHFTEQVTDTLPNTELTCVGFNSVELFVRSKKKRGTDKYPVYILGSSLAPSKPVFEPYNLCESPNHAPVEYEQLNSLVSINNEGSKYILRLKTKNNIKKIVPDEIRISFRYNQHNKRRFPKKLKDLNAVMISKTLVGGDALVEKRMLGKCEEDKSSSQI